MQLDPLHTPTRKENVVMPKKRRTSENQTWYAKGIRFECQGSGNCCSSRGEYGYVYFSAADRRKAAKELGISTAAFTRKYCQKVDGFYALKDNPDGPDCLFLKNHRCTIYAGRPTQCRTWPFWPEVMNAKSWRKDVESFCPGVNKGRLHSAQQIDETMAEQRKTEMAMLHELSRVALHD